VDKFPLRPTSCIHSGHGLQCIWLYREPWVLSVRTKQGRGDAIKGMALHLSMIANKQSYELDPVHDITRVMRLPGTHNVKDPAKPKDVTLLWHDEDLRYNPADIDENVVEFSAGAKRPAEHTARGPVLFVPLDKHEAMMEIDDYKGTWNHSRTDLDGDCSRFDMALASFAVAAGFADDEIAALLRKHREKWGKDKPEKLDDQRYYGRTIARARSAKSVEQAKTKAVQTIEHNDGTREEMIQALAARFEIPLTNIQCISGSPAYTAFG